jgi:hypothetical protein
MLQSHTVPHIAPLMHPDHTHRDLGAGARVGDPYLANLPPIAVLFAPGFPQLECCYCRALLAVVSIPAIRYGPELTNSEQHDILTRRLQLYLSRSGNTHIAFTFEYVYSDPLLNLQRIIRHWETNRAKIFDIFRLLADHSHRWQDATIRGPSEILSVVAEVQKLPVLSKLSLEILLPKRSVTSHADCFSSAPSLREVSISAPTEELWYINHVFPETAFAISLPWAQLEKYEGKIVRDTSYLKSMQVSRYSLHELNYSSAQLPIPRNIPITTMKHLTRLSFSSCWFTDMAQGHGTAGHLDISRLPSLTDLQVHSTSFAHRMSSTAASYPSYAARGALWST